MKDKPLYQTIAEGIAKQIDDGSYPVGSRLPAERELAERFGVSRVTIREAEIALQAIGKVQIKTGSGVYVAADDETLKAQLPDVSAFELTEARALFEAEAAALAAVQISDEGIAELETYVDIMANTGPGLDAGEKADKDFHQAIAKASGNNAILYLIESMWQMRTEIQPVKEVYASVCAEDVGAIALEHSQILDAIKARDPNGARLAMRNHFSRLLESMLNVTEAQALQEIRKKTTASRQRYLKNMTVSEGSTSNVSS